MINPNKLYKASQTGTVIHIESVGTYLAQFTVDYGTSGTYKGFIKDIPNFKRFKVGDRVTCSMQYSITGEAFRVHSMRRRLK